MPSRSRTAPLSIASKPFASSSSFCRARALFPAPTSRGRRREPGQQLLQHGGVNRLDQVEVELAPIRSTLPARFSGSTVALGSGVRLRSRSSSACRYRKTLRRAGIPLPPARRQRRLPRRRPYELRSRAFREGRRANPPSPCCRPQRGCDDGGLPRLPRRARPTDRPFRNGAHDR
jgi:hypothetical protein